MGILLFCVCVLYIYKSHKKEKENKLKIPSFLKDFLNYPVLLFTIIVLKVWPLVKYKSSS